MKNITFFLKFGVYLFFFKRLMHVREINNKAKHEQGKDVFHAPISNYVATWPVTGQSCYSAAADCDRSQERAPGQCIETAGKAHELQNDVCQ